MLVPKALQSVNRGAMVAAEVVALTTIGNRAGQDRLTGPGVIG